MKRLRSHMVTVYSTDQPGNTATNFIARLPEPLDLPLGLYDVGLLNLQIERLVMEPEIMHDAPEAR